MTIIRPEGLHDDVPLVLFLHGWGATEPRTYRPWLEHLAREGNAVIYPRYQDSFAEPPAQVLGNVVLGVRAALRRLDEDPGSLVVAGHSAGGALAADYAAVARSVGLPPPRAVFAAYPGRRFARRADRHPLGRRDPARHRGARAPRRGRPRRRPGRGARDRRARAPARRPDGRRPRSPRAAAGRSGVPARVLGPARRADRRCARLELGERAARVRVEAAAEEDLLGTGDEGAWDARSTAQRPFKPLTASLRPGSVAAWSAVSTSFFSARSRSATTAARSTSAACASAACSPCCCSAPARSCPRTR